MQRPKKSLGQNFLHDANVVEKIVRHFSPRPEETIVEIGPGKGALTAQLLTMIPHLTVIELDDQLVPELLVQFGEKITILHQDILKTDLASLRGAEGNKIRIIGNIPYYITSPILFHVIEARSVVKDFTVMMQTEVARRLMAQPHTKEYGITSVFLQYYCTTKNVFAVSKNSFFPIPDVSSTVVHLDFEQPFPNQASNDTLFRSVVRGTFGKRRKTLRNGLRGMGIAPADVEKIEFDLERRPEELSVAEFVQLSTMIDRLNIFTAVRDEREEFHDE